jgi:hypothetical protein
MTDRGLVVAVPCVADIDHASSATVRLKPHRVMSAFLVESRERDVIVWTRQVACSVLSNGVKVAPAKGPQDSERDAQRGASHAAVPRFTLPHAFATGLGMSAIRSASSHTWSVRPAAIARVTRSVW